MVILLSQEKEGKKAKQKKIILKFAENKKLELGTVIILEFPKELDISW